MEVVFRRIYQVERQGFSEEVIQKFPHANEYFEVLVKPASELSPFVSKLVHGQDCKSEYEALSDEEKEGARDLMFTLIQLQPNAVNARAIQNALNSEEAKGKKAISSALELLNMYIEEKQRNSVAEQIPFAESQNQYFALITAVGKQIIPVSPASMDGGPFGLLA